MEVIRAHYDKLQGHLKKLNMDRNKPECDAVKHDVLSEKLKFFQSIAKDGALPPRHPDNNDIRVGDDDDPEARIEGNPEFDSFFPFTLRREIQIAESVIWISLLSSSRPTVSTSIQHFSFIKSIITSRS